jgi:hypothetical protein
VTAGNKSYKVSQLPQMLKDIGQGQLVSAAASIVLGAAMPCNECLLYFVLHAPPNKEWEPPSGANKRLIGMRIGMRQLAGIACTC